MSKLHLIMPMGGKGSRFIDKGFDFPKPLLKLHARPFFFWSVQSIAKFIELKDITFIVLQEHVEKYRIDDEIQNYYPKARIHIIPEVLDGAVLTCLEGLKEIHDGDPLLINDCDHLFKSSQFESMFAANDMVEIDGGLMTFKSNEEKYSYVKYDDRNCIIGTIEKKVVSEDAICGCYYFRNKKLFQNCAEIYLKGCEYKEFYISGLYNIIAESKGIIRTFQTDFHIPYGTPEELETAKSFTGFGELE